MATAPRKTFRLENLYVKKEGKITVFPITTSMTNDEAWRSIEAVIKQVLGEQFREAKIEPATSDQMIISFPAETKQVSVDSDGYMSPPINLGGAGLSKGDVPFKGLINRDPSDIGIGFKVYQSTSAPTPVSTPTPAPATDTPNVTSECGLSASDIPKPQPSPEKPLPVFPDVTKDRVRDTFEELQKKYPSMPVLQPSSELNLGGGYCAAWSLWIQSKLIKLSAEEYWDLPYEGREKVYAKVIYGLNPTTSRFTPIGTLRMKTEVEQTIVPGKRVLAPRTKRDATTGKAETLTPGRLSNNPTGSFPMLDNFAEKVMDPATQAPDAPFRSISLPFRYHIIDTYAVPLFGDFVKLNDTTPDPKPILFNVVAKVNPTGSHALCFVYFPKSHEIDIVSTYTLSPTMSKDVVLGVMYEPTVVSGGKPYYPVLNKIERALHLPITPRPAGRRKTFRKRASERKIRRRRTIRR